MFLKYIHFPAFFISFLLGLLFIYIWGPEMKTIYIYPSPESVERILLRDRAGNCFQFEEMIVKCPTDPNKISQIPIQD